MGDYLAGMAVMGAMWLAWAVLSWAFRLECRVDRLEDRVQDLERRSGDKP